TIYAAMLAVIIAGSISFLSSQIPDAQLLGWPIAKMKQGIETVTWAAVLPMFFYLRTGLARARSQGVAAASVESAESSVFKFWRFAFVTAFVWMAVIEVMNVLVDLFVNSFLNALSAAGLLQFNAKGEELAKFVDIQLTTQSIVILPIMAFCGLAAGWIAHKAVLRRRVLYVFSAALIFIGFRVIEFIVGLSFGFPAMKSLIQSGISVASYFLFFPLGLFLLSLIGFSVRAIIQKISSIFVGVPRHEPTPV